MSAVPRAVMAGPGLAIHDFSWLQDVDTRPKAGHDVACRGVAA
jgi:hypothetical protein